MAGTELPVRDALCLPGILLTAAGALLVRHSVDVNAELRCACSQLQICMRCPSRMLNPEFRMLSSRAPAAPVVLQGGASHGTQPKLNNADTRACRPILDAKAFDTLEDLDQALQNGLRLPATVAIRHAPAGTTDPVQPALSTGKAVLCLSTHLVETIDGSANAFNTRVRSRSTATVHTCTDAATESRIVPQVRVRDSSALRKPSTWFVRGHGAALAVTPRVHTSLASPPWSSFQERRQAVADGNWQTLVSRRLLAVVLKQRLPSALITQERTLAVDSPVAVVGTLRHLLRKDSRFATPGSLRAHSQSLPWKRWLVRDVADRTLAARRA